MADEKLKWKIFFDTSEVKEAQVTSKKAFTQMERAAWRLMTPIEKTEKQIQEWKDRAAEMPGGADIAAEAIGRLEDKLEGLKTETDESVESLKGFAKNWKSVGAGLVGGFGIAGLIGGMKSFHGFIVDTIREQGELIKQFERFGLSAAENMNRYKAAAAEAGTELDSLVEANKNLTIRLGEAVQDKGVGEVSDVFRQLGLDFEKLARMKPDEQMEAFGKAIDELIKAGKFNEALTLTDILLSDDGTRNLQAIVDLARKGTDEFDSMYNKIKRADQALKDWDRAKKEGGIAIASTLAGPLEAASKTATSMANADGPLDMLQTYGTAALMATPLLGRLTRGTGMSEQLGYHQVKLAERDTRSNEEIRAAVVEQEGIARAQRNLEFDKRIFSKLRDRGNIAKMKGLGRAGSSVLDSFRGAAGFLGGGAGIPERMAATGQARQYQEWLKGKDGGGFKNEMRGPIGSMGAGSSAAFQMLQKKQVRVVDPAQKTRGEILAEQKKQSKELSRIASEIVDGSFKPGKGFTFANLNGGN